MPTILTLGRYVLFFWLGESDEPVHIHVAIRRPTEHATEFWLTARWWLHPSEQRK